jgi:hypothetical protein
MSVRLLTFGKRAGITSYWGLILAESVLGLDRFLMVEWVWANGRRLVRVLRSELHSKA